MLCCFPPLSLPHNNPSSHQPTLTHTLSLPPPHLLFSLSPSLLLHLNLSSPISLFSLSLPPIIPFPSLLFSYFLFVRLVSFCFLSFLFFFCKNFSLLFLIDHFSPLPSVSPPLLSSRHSLHAAINQKRRIKKVQLVNRSFKKGRAMISLRVEQHSDFSRFRQYHCPSSRGNDDSTAFHGNADCQ